MLTIPRVKMSQCAYKVGPPSPLLLKILSVAGFSARTSAASCRIVRMTVKRLQEGGCSIYCRLLFNS